MRIEGLSQNLLPTRTAASQPVVQAWQIGQTIKATVVSEVSAGAVTLRVGEAEIPAQTVLALNKGETLTLRVEQQAGQLNLRLIGREALVAKDLARVAPDGRTAGSAARADPAATAIRVLLQATLRSTLPTQRPLTGPLNALSELAPKMLASGVGNLRPIAHHLRTLLAGLPSARDLIEPRSLAKASRQSGTFFEARARAELSGGRSAEPLTGDFKAQLAQLVGRARIAVAAGPAWLSASASQEATPRNKPRGAELLKSLLPEAEAALNRVQVNQLRSAPTADNPNPPWVVEIPVKGPPAYHDVKMTIERDANNPADEAGNWSLTVWFELPELGGMGARLHWADEHLSVLVLAERDDTRELINDELATLQSGLEGAGLHVSALNCRTACAPSDPPHGVPGVIDAQA